jgi:hypothetical protein
MMNFISRLIKQHQCDHFWNHRLITGDARLQLGRVEEWWCIHCGKITGKNPLPPQTATQPKDQA